MQLKNRHEMTDSRRRSLAALRHMHRASLALQPDDWIHASTQVENSTAVGVDEARPVKNERETVKKRASCCKDPATNIVLSHVTERKE